MNIELDEESGQVSAQFPDTFIALLPAGVKHEPKTGKEIHYRGSLIITRGNERIHLNAFDIDDLERFLASSDVQRVRRVMTEQHVKLNILRSILSLRGDNNEDNLRD